MVVSLRPVAGVLPRPTFPEHDTRTDRQQPAQAPAAPPGPASMPASTPEALGELSPQTSHATTAGTGPGPDGWSDEYLPRSALTRGPEPSAEVLLTYPDGAPDGHWQGELTLFIDEHGVVQRVRVESSEARLPQPFREAARQAFLNARFTPGEWQGQPVRSRIRIAVEFEASPSFGHSGALR